VNPFALEAWAQRLGNPPWFWPLVFIVLLGLLMVGSMEGGAP
jgi:hypothetical protein